MLIFNRRLQYHRYQFHITARLSSSNMERGTADNSNPLTTVMRLSTYNEIAAKLLDDKLLLTALEFHAELCEAGTVLPILKDYFGNPNNLENQIVRTEPCVSIVRSSSQATLDSLDMTRYSEDGGGTDERVAILEFELRKARENISALRANLTVITESESTIPDEITDKIQLCDAPIKPHEQRALNFLVNEYLMVQSYKLTSITFSDENENQDFENWEDVGLDIPKPSNLLQIYREFYRKNDHSKASPVDASLQVNLDELFSSDNDGISQKTNCSSNDTTIKENLEHLKGKIICLEKRKIDPEKCICAVDLEQCVTAESQFQMHKIISVSNATTTNKFEMIASSYQDISQTFNVADKESEIGPADKDWMNIQSLNVDTEASSSTAIRNPHTQTSLETFTKQVFAHSLINISVNDDDDDKNHDANNNNNNDDDDADDDDDDNVVNDNDDYYYHKNEDPMNCSIDTDNKSQESLKDIIARVLPKIVPYIASNKRDHVIPLIMNSIIVNSDTVQRDELLRLLLNLKEKPQQSEREILLKALISLVKMKTSAIEPERIITLCWEQCHHKYRERRLLAVECCTALAPYTSSAIKNSLMISMLQQILLEDKEPMVRAAVVRTLALLIALNDDPSKYFQCEELALAALDDESSQVFDIAYTVLLPTLARWALKLKRLLSHLLVRIISKLKDLLKPEKNLHCSGHDHRGSEKIVRLISVLKILLPHMIVCVVNNPIVECRINNNTPLELPEKLLLLSHSSITNPLFFSNNSGNIVQIINTFLANDWEDVTWTELEWLTGVLFPDIMIMVKLLNTSQEVALTCLLSYVESLCNGLGHYIVQFGIMRIFMPEIVELEKKLIVYNHTSNSSNINLTLIPAHMIILSTVNFIELSNALSHFIVLISNSGADVNCLIITFRILSKRRDIIEQIVDVLWDGVVNQKANVRSTTAILFANIIENVPEQMVTSRITPAIITLASDSDLSVKATAVEALGKLIKCCPAKEAKDKGLLTLESIIMEIDRASIAENLCISLISTLTSIVSDSPQHFIEDVFATQLCKMSALGLQKNLGVELTIALVDAYSTLVYCSLNNQCITNVLLPGLGYLQSLVNQHLPHRNENIRSLIREAESRVYTVRPIERSICPNSGLSLSITASNVGQGVEDMRQRMTKIFTPKSHSQSMANIFRKN